MDRTMLIGSRTVLLLEVTAAGRTWRWSTEPVDVTSTTPRDGTQTLRFDGGLDGLDVDEVLAALADRPQARSASMEVEWPSDIAELRSWYHTLRAAPSEVSAWQVGTTYEERYVLVSGRAKLPEYGEVGERVALSVEEEPYEDRALWPPESHQVSEDTWPDALESHRGRYYPTVWGTPGVYTGVAGTEQRKPGSPALCVDFDSTNSAQKLLIAGHRVQATTVRLGYRNPRGSITGATGTVTHERDGLGVECAVVDVSGETAEFREAGEWWVIWNGGGALANPYRPNAYIRTFGDAIRWWLDRSTLRRDRGAIASLCSTLTWPCSGYVDEPATPWEVVSRRFLPHLPVTVGAGSAGLYLAPWRWNATSRDVVLALTEGPGVVVLGRITPVEDEVSQIVRIRWARDVSEGEFLQTLTLTPKPTFGDRNQTSNAIVRASAARYPDRLGTVEVECDVCYDHATAYNIATWTAWRNAFEREELVVEVEIEEAGWLRLGDVVSITSASRSLSSKLAIVQDRQWRPHRRLRLTLALLDGTLTSRPTTGPDPDPNEPSWRPSN